MASVPGLGQIGTQAYFAFEIFGKVQGVYFRKYTAEKAASLGLLGFVRNTELGTVTGAAHGTTTACADFKHWLRNTGSPKSRIERAVFSKEVFQVEPFSVFKSFEIRK